LYNFAEQKYVFTTQRRKLPAISSRLAWCTKAGKGLFMVEEINWEGLLRLCCIKRTTPSTVCLVPTCMNWYSGAASRVKQCKLTLQEFWIVESYKLVEQPLKWVWSKSLIT